MNDDTNSLDEAQARISELDQDFGLVSYERVMEIIEDVREEWR